jgi:hypothetical protein
MPNFTIHSQQIASSNSKCSVLATSARHKVKCVNYSLSERIWKSLVTLEFVVTSILGREPASLLVHPGHANFEQMMHTRQRNTPDPALQANYQLSWLINDVMSNFYQRETVTIEAAQLYMEKIDLWLENLDESLSLNDKPANIDPEAWAQVIGSLHVSCFYHFAVTLICRPFLIQQLRRRLAPGDPTNGGTDSNPIFEDGPEVADLAEKCVTAARYMAETCAEVLQAGLFKESMTLLK